MVNLEINNQTKFKIPAKTLTPVLDLARKELKIKTEQSVSLAFVGPARMKSLNKRYRGKNKVTDVLSFKTDKCCGDCKCTRYQIPCTRYNSSSQFIGEIIICPAQAKKQAKEFGNPFIAELRKLVLHGYLHLLGFDHENDADAEKMEGIEKLVL